MEQGLCKMVNEFRGWGQEPSLTQLEALPIALHSGPSLNAFEVNLVFI